MPLRPRGRTRFARALLNEINATTRATSSRPRMRSCAGEVARTKWRERSCAGEVVAGEVVAGEVVAGEVVAGEVVAGEKSCCPLVRAGGSTRLPDGPQKSRRARREALCRSPVSQGSPGTGYWSLPTMATARTLQSGTLMSPSKCPNIRKNVLKALP